MPSRLKKEKDTGKDLPHEDRYKLQPKGSVTEGMNKAQRLLETMNDFTKSDDEIAMRSNHRYGTRCLQCGRMLAKINKFPAVRSCPCPECDGKYEISRSNRGLMFKRLH